MNLDRIASSIEIDKMQHSHVTMIGGGYGLVEDLVHCGLGGVTLVDFDHIEASNVARQDFAATDIGRLKIEAVADHLWTINPDLDVTCLARDFCSMSPAECDAQFGHTNLFIVTTDFHPAQARGNIEALRLHIPALWIGLYRGGRAGELVFWHEGLACYRCICESRYQAFASGTASKIPSTGGTIFDLHLVDSIAGYLAVGQLTRGADNRMGRLIDQLGNRNLLQVKIDPDYRLGERDIFAQYLGKDPANFSFTTIALPMVRDPACPDCGKLVHNQEEPLCDES